MEVHSDGEEPEQAPEKPKSGSLPWPVLVFAVSIAVGMLLFLFFPSLLPKLLVPVLILVPAIAGILSASTEDGKEDAKKCK